MVAQHGVVYEADSRYPVTMLGFSIALYVVLPSREIPHKVSPIHEVALVGEEEAQVFQLGGHFHHNRFAAAVVGNSVAVHASHPTLVGSGVITAVHAWEKHVLGVDILALVVYNEVGVFLVG